MLTITGTATTNPRPGIVFYIPAEVLRKADIPGTIEGYWNSPLQSFKEGKFVWTLQTYLYLREAGYPCQLSHNMERNSIILSHRDFLSSPIIPRRDQLLVCIKAERSVHPFAQLHVIQNSCDNLDQGRYAHLWHRQRITHWPQGGLVPRAPARGDRFENIAYFGVSEEMLDELASEAWSRRLQQIGLRWCPITEKECWNDYSDVDAVIAIRPPNRGHQCKPPSKLHNAWRTGVPAILGPESAYQAERASDLDYIEALSADEAFDALKTLKENSALRENMAAHGLMRAQEVRAERIAEQWMAFLDQVAVPAYEAWKSSSTVSRYTFFLRRLLRYWILSRQP